MNPIEREFLEECSERDKAITLERHAHDERDQAGRYSKTPPCDACGKPVGTNYFTDDEVCGSSDGPGFYLCERKRCIKVRDNKTVEERRALYTAQRAKLPHQQSAPTRVHPIGVSPECPHIPLGGIVALALPLRGFEIPSGPYVPSDLTPNDLLLPGCQKGLDQGLAPTPVLRTPYTERVPEGPHHAGESPRMYLWAFCRASRIRSSSAPT